MSDTFGVAPAIPVLSAKPPGLAGFVRVYARAGLVYGVDEAGVETLLTNQGVSGVPPGALIVTDALGPLKLIYAESNSALAETARFTLNLKYVESLATTTEAVTLRLNGLMDTNAVPADAATMTVVYTASGTWVPPTGVTSAIVECMGGGQSGAVGTAVAGGRGGNGGDYARSTVAVTSAKTYAVTVGGVASGGAAGQDTFVRLDGADLVRAQGGNSGMGNLGAVVFAGGTGAAGAALGTGGGGGGAAGADSAGANASGATAGNPGATISKTYYIKGGRGGNGSTGAGVVGTAPGGGGGGGGGSVTSPGAGSAGTRGEVRVTWVLA